eukprot:gene29779-23701_t
MRLEVVKLDEIKRRVPCQINYPHAGLFPLDGECDVCMEGFEFGPCNPTITICGHVFCGSSVLLTRSSSLPQRRVKSNLFLHYSPLPPPDWHRKSELNLYQWCSQFDQCKWYSQFRHDQGGRRRPAP